MISYKDCPECGARKIHSTVRLCEVCETCEKYESKLAGEAAHIKSLEGLLLDACRERDAMRGAVKKLLLSRDVSWAGGHDWQEAVGDAIAALGMKGASE
jgi:hypothetical protein